VPSIGGNEGIAVERVKKGTEGGFYTSMGFYDNLDKFGGPD